MLSLFSDCVSMFHRAASPIRLTSTLAQTTRTSLHPLRGVYMLSNKIHVIPGIMIWKKSFIIPSKNIQNIFVIK